MAFDSLRRGLDRYRAVSRIPAAKTLLGANFVGHVPIGMGTLTLLLGTAEVTDSYSAAGLVVGVYVVASGATAPFWGRAIDRWGAYRILIGMALGFMASLGVLIAAMASVSPLSMIIAAVVASGASRPALTGAVQSLWAHLTPDDEDVRKSAYALHAMQLGLVWILGPLIVTGIVGVLGPRLGPLVSLAAVGVLTAAGAVLVAIVWKRQGPRPVPRDRSSTGPTPDGPRLYTRAYIVILVSVMLFEAALGAGFVTMGVFAEHAGIPSATGLLVALWFTGGIIGGALFGSKHTTRSLAQQYRWCLIALTTGYVFCSLLSSPWLLGAALLAAGTALSPTHTIQYSLIADLAPPGSRGEGFTWLSTTVGAGGALGTGLAGPTISHFGQSYAGFALAAFCALTAAVVASPMFIGQRASVEQAKAPRTNTRKESATWQPPSVT